MRGEIMEKLGIKMSDRVDVYWRLFWTLNKLGIEIDYTDEHLFDLKMLEIERKRKDRVDILETVLVAVVMFTAVMWALYAPGF